MAVTYLDPTAQPAAPPETYELEVGNAEQVTIGLLANGFPDSVPFLHIVGDRLSKARAGVTVLEWNKGEASQAASEELISEVTDRSDAVVAAYGH